MYVAGSTDDIYKANLSLSGNAKIKVKTIKTQIHIRPAIKNGRKSSSLSFLEANALASKKKKQTLKTNRLTGAESF